MRDRRDIRDRREAGGTIRGIARETGASRNAVRRGLDSDARLAYSRPSMAEEYEPAVRDMLADYPRVSVSQVAELIDWPGSRRTLSDLVARLRPEYLAREIEDLNRPALGRVAAGKMTVGSVTVGTITLGRIRHGSTTGPDDSARPA